MDNFFLPTSIRMGSGCVIAAADELGAIAPSWLVVTGRHAARASGALGDVVSALTAAGASWELFDEVAENPSIACVRAGAERACAFGARGILSIGGGSPMDAGKAIALVAADPNIDDERLLRGPWPAGCLPIVCVPTTAGTGSEVTKASILTDDAAKTKSSISTPLIFPRLALVDSRYLASVPQRTMVNTVIDALSHALEGYLARGAGGISDSLAADALRRTGGLLHALAEGELDEAGRKSAMLAATEAGAVIAQTGTTAVHALGYSLTYFRHIPHGRANGLLLPGWLTWLDARMPERVADVLGYLDMSSIPSFSDALDLLLGKREHVTEDEIAEYARRAARAGNIANCPVRPTVDDLAGILRASLRS